EVDLVHQQTQNQRYGSSHIGATAKDISNVVTDAASGVVDIFHGIDKAVADTWNNFWKDGKADGIRSEERRVGKECRSRPLRNPPQSDAHRRGADGRGEADRPVRIRSHSARSARL